MFFKMSSQDIFQNVLKMSSKCPQMSRTFSKKSWTFSKMSSKCCGLCWVEGRGGGLGGGGGWGGGLWAVVHWWRRRCRRRRRRRRRRPHRRRHSRRRRPRRHRPCRWVVAVVVVAVAVLVLVLVAVFALVVVCHPRRPSHPHPSHPNNKSIFDKSNVKTSFCLKAILHPMLKAQFFESSYSLTIQVFTKALFINPIV